MKERFSLPNVDDIHLKDAPVKEVICQLMFPSIVKLGLYVDPSFQEDIRYEYPFYERLINDRPVNDQLVRQLKFPSDQLNHAFVNKAGTEKINIMQNFLAFSTNAYENWGSFFPKVKQSFECFSKHYSPAVFVRTGLRYINLLDTELIPDLKERPLGDFIKEPFLGPIASKSIDNPYLSAYSSSLTIRDRQNITIHYGIGISPEEAEIEENKRNRIFFVDIDVYKQGIAEIDTLDQTLDEAHKLAYETLRWVVTDGTISLLY